MVRERGQVSTQTTQQFIDAGFSKSLVLEVIIAIALETIASYTGRALATPIDEQYQLNLWTRRVTTGVN